MFEKDILARLQNGEDASKIAEEMASALNKAQAAYSEEQKAAAALEQCQKEKEADMKAILSMLKDYFIKYNIISDPTVLASFEDVDVSDIVESFDELGEVMTSLLDFANVIETKKEKSKPKVAAAGNPAGDPDKIISNFLNMMNW